MAAEPRPTGGYTIKRTANYRVPNAHVRPNSLDTGTIAWILHKITGVFLVVYLLIHIFVVGQGVRGEEAFDEAISFVQKPIFVFLDAGLAGVVAYHAFNGLRIVAFDLGWGIRQQKALFWLSLLISVAVFLGSLWVVRDLL
jgi:succinate dehydrogenase / fumarate reductase, cytochrome b subunit